METKSGIFGSRNNNRLGSGGSNLNMDVDLGDWTLSFLNNPDSGNGGAMYLSNEQQISFNKGAVNFTGNSAGISEGAIYNAGRLTFDTHEVY
jgi:hypothetical protein